MDILDEEILNLWKLLYQFKVKYIMIGGFATNLHGFHRTTGDMDIWIKDSLENRKNLRAVFNEMAIGDFESLETTQLIPVWSSIYLNSGFEIDIMTSIKGFEQETFEGCYEISPIALIHEIAVKFLHINKLIESKKITGRSKDKLDVEELERLRDKKDSDL